MSETQQVAERIKTQLVTAALEGYRSGTDIETTWYGYVDLADVERLVELVLTLEPGTGDTDSSL